MTEEPRSSPQYLARFVHREVVVLAVLCAVAAGVFSLTKIAAAASHDLRERDGRVWYERGLADLREGRASQAVEALARARALDRSERDYHLALSRALIAVGQRDSARQTLLSLRESTPEDPHINLALAELEIDAGNAEAAVRYFQSAMHGAWSADELDARRVLRRRMAEYLLEQDMASRAIAQLLLLQDDVPAEPDAHTDVADLFLRAGDASHALAAYRRALAADPGHAAALAGAARAAFALGDYRGASRYLARAPRAQPLNDLRLLTAAVLAADPLVPGLRAQEQRRRLDAGRTVVTDAIDACGAKLGQQVPPSLAGHVRELTQLRRETAGPVARTPEDEAATIERAATAVPEECAPFDMSFRAWVSLARTRLGEGG